MSKTPKQILESHIEDLNNQIATLRDELTRADANDAGAQVRISQQITVLKDQLEETIKNSERFLK